MRHVLLAVSGPSGVGKTTVARLLSRLYKAIGVLEKGTLVEVDRSALVAGYVGQTALKTKEALDLFVSQFQRKPYKPAWNCG